MSFQDLSSGRFKGCVHGDLMGLGDFLTNAVMVSLLTLMCITVHFGFSFINRFHVIFSRHLCMLLVKVIVL